MNSIIWRLIRGTVATAISGWVATVQADARYAYLVPVILAAGKALRLKFPKKLGWLPI